MEICDFCNLRMCQNKCLCFMLLSHQYIQGYCRSMVSPEDVVRARMLLELLFIRSGAFCLDIFTLSDVKVMIDSLSTY